MDPMDKSKQTNDVRTFTITGLDGKTTGRVKAKSIWQAYENAVMQGDIIAFESLVQKEGN
jgi:hypothetical protein